MRKRGSSISIDGALPSLQSPSSKSSDKRSLLEQLSTLKNEVDLAAMRITSTEQQWRRDREAFNEEKQDMQAMLTKVTNKLIVAEGKKRFNHQVGRDDNFVLNVVGIYEHQQACLQRDEAKQRIVELENELAEAVKECNEKDQQIKAALRTAEDAKFELTKGQKEVNDMKRHLHEQIDTFQEELEAANQRNSDLQQRISDLQKNSLDQGSRMLEMSQGQMDAEEAEKRRILQEAEGNKKNFAAEKDRLLAEQKRYHQEFEAEKQRLLEESERHRLLAEKHAADVEREKQKQQHIGTFFLSMY